MIEEMREERSAYVQFEVRAMEDRAASEAAGHYVAQDVEFVTITPPGNGTLQVERLIDKVVIARYGAQYEAWKKGLEPPVDGTSLRDWPPATPGQIATLLAMHVRTVEDLAALNEPGLQRLGIGARALQTKARTWLESAGEHGKIAEKMATMQVQVDELKVALDTAMESNAELMAEVRRLNPEAAPKRRGRPPKGV